MKSWVRALPSLVVAIFVHSAAAKHGQAVPTPTPTPAPSGPAAPVLVTPAAGVSLVQPLTLDWNAVSATGGPIGSYTWQVSTASSFTTIIASGFTNMESDPTIPT